MSRVIVFEGLKVAFAPNGMATQLFLNGENVTKYFNSVTVHAAVDAATVVTLTVPGGGSFEYTGPLEVEGMALLMRVEGVER